MGPLERRLLWTTLDARRRKSMDDRRRGGGSAPPGMADLGGGAAAGLATAGTGPEELIGTPDWVAEFRCAWSLVPDAAFPDFRKHVG